MFGIASGLVGLIVSVNTASAEYTDTSTEKDDPGICVIVDEHWNRIKNAEHENEELYKDDLIEYWSIIMEECQNEFISLIKVAEERGELRAAMALFVDKFGTGDVQADVRWLVANPLTISTRPDPVPETAQADTRYERWRQIDLLTAEFQVQRLLDEPEMLTRYYHAVVWLGDVFEGHNFPLRVDGLNQHFHDDSGEYWWRARDFLMMAYGTGRDDLLKDVKPDELHLKYQEWFAWWQRFGPSVRPDEEEEYRWKVSDLALRARINLLLGAGRYRFPLPALPQRPKQPFPNWEGPPFISPGVLRELW